ncbi:MAG: phage holin family protein [Proteobacteria bacterium]|nr:phage holin family protein [Pseudomonadota bacterium]
MSEAPIGEMVSQLVDDGKRYARAEIALYRAKALDKAQPLKAAAILGGIAFVLAFSSIAALLFGLILALAPLAGALGATVIVIGAALALAALLGYLAVRKVREVVQ